MSKAFMSLLMTSKMELIGCETDGAAIKVLEKKPEWTAMSIQYEKERTEMFEVIFLPALFR
jgi:hypothetical protein